MNGVHHFYRNNAINYNDNLKRKILENFNWRVIEISYFDWDKLDRESKEEHIESLIYNKNKD